jgi:hypothetical protein
LSINFETLYFTLNDPIPFAIIYLMYNHAPEGYDCPLCLLGKEEYRAPLVVVPEDVVYRNEFVTACISSRFYLKPMAISATMLI